MDEQQKDDAADFALLSMANDKGVFAVQLGYVGTREHREALERGFDQQWFTFLDSSCASSG